MYMCIYIYVYPHHVSLVLGEKGYIVAYFKLQHHDTLVTKQLLTLWITPEHREPNLTDNSGQKPFSEQGNMRHRKQTTKGKS